MLKKDPPHRRIMAARMAASPRFRGDGFGLVGPSRQVTTKAPHQSSADELVMRVVFNNQSKRSDAVAAFPSNVSKRSEYVSVSSKSQIECGTKRQ